MNRALAIVNLVGVLALAALCAVQWAVNRRLNHLAIDLETARLRQADQIAERDRTIRGQAADLDEFRQRLTLAESQLKELDEKLAATTRERNQLLVRQQQLVAERDQLKAAVDRWAAAVEERDQALRQAGEQTKRAVADRNEAVARFNDLAARYNALVKDWNAAQPQTRPATRAAAP